MPFLEDIFLSLWSLRSPFSRVGVILPSVLSSRQYFKAALAALFLLLTYSGVSAAQTQYTIWPSTAVPGNLDVGPDSPVELGISFKSDVNGYITGIRFHKGSNNTGTHVGNLWNSTGTLLGSATFTNETASGWQQVNFSKPVAITANANYVASYHTNTAHLSVNPSYFATSGLSNGPLSAPANGNGSGNGVYLYGSGSGFPTYTYNSSNYWVDLVFTPNTFL